MTATNRLFNLIADESSVSSDVENSQQLDRSNAKSRVKAIIEDSLYEDCPESPLEEINSNTNKKRDSNLARQFRESIIIDDTKSSVSESDGESEAEVGSESDKESKTENNNQSQSVGESESNSESNSESSSEGDNESNSDETNNETDESGSSSEGNSARGTDKSVDKSSSDDVQPRKVNQVKRNVIQSDSEDDQFPKLDVKKEQTPKTPAPVSKKTIENSPVFELLDSGEIQDAELKELEKKQDHSILSVEESQVDTNVTKPQQALQTSKNDDLYLNEESFTKMKSNLNMMNTKAQKSYDQDNDVLNDSDPVELSNINENMRESILSSTKYHIPSDLKQNDKPLASWSPNFEKVKSKVKQSQLEREQQQRKIQVIELSSDSEDKKKSQDIEIIDSKVDANAMLMKLQKQFDMPRNSTKQVQNRNIGFEEKLKVLSENMIQVMESKPNQDEDVNYQQLAKQPTGMKVKLLPHQCYSMRWLKWREENYPNGSILADDMGLGKTLTILAYLRMVKDLKHEAIKEKLKLNDDEEDEDQDKDDEDEIGNKYQSKLKFKKRQKSTSRKLDELVPPLKTLIILPASLLCQWQSEIKSKFEANVFKVYCYHDANRKKYAYNLDANDIVFTTYEIVSREIDLIDDESAYKAASASPLIKVKWKRIILDEAHRIKNHTTKANKSICQLRAKYRIALTGTPIHNSLNDLYSLVKFLHFDPLSDFSLWKYIFASETSTKPGAANNATSVERVKRLDSWMVFLSDYLILRRTKEDKLHFDNQKPIVDLPGKTIETIKFPLGLEEKAIYMKIFNESKEKVNKILMSHQQRLLGKTNVNANGNLSDIFVYLLRLRQACCHMSLLAECLDKDELQKIKLETEGIEGLMSNLNINENNTTKNENEMLDLNSLQSNVDLSKCLKRSFKSSKLSRLIDMVEELLERYPDDKMIIVSQWTSMLSLVARYLQSNEIEYCEIKGDINLVKRNEIVEDFNRESNVSMRVMLLSLTAGGVGLNLVGANRMFLLDIHWNPALEHQASDRIYRVGQRKPCTIYRFLCENTIEERIRQIQEFKLQLASKVCSAAAGSSLTAGGTGTAASKLTLRDFKLLFTDFE